MPKKKKTKETKAFRDLSRDYIGEVFGVRYHKDIQVIPEGKSGSYEVKDKLAKGHKYIYQTLLLDGKLVADNDPANLSRHSQILSLAEGDIMVSGLGLGDLLHQLLQMEQVDHVTVIEKDQNVIKLVKPSFARYGRRITIKRGDIFDLKLKKSGHYSVIYHAIWNDKASILAKQRKRLEEMYSSLCDWHGFVYDSNRGGARPNTGRKAGVQIGPIKSEEDKRSIRKGIRFTSREYELIEKAAKALGESPSAIMQRGAVKESVQVLQTVLKTTSLEELG